MIVPRPVYLALTCLAHVRLALDFLFRDLRFRSLADCAFNLGDLVTETLVLYTELGTTFITDITYVNMIENPSRLRSKVIAPL
jgi:hypothetical protein